MEEVIILSVLVFLEAIVSITCVHLLNTPSKKRRRHRWWVKPIIAQRNQEGSMRILLSKGPSDGFYYEHYLRMSKENFIFLLEKIESHLQKPDDKYRKSITPSEKLSVTLRYLATGSLWFMLILKVFNWHFMYFSA